MFSRERKRLYSLIMLACGMFITIVVFSYLGIKNRHYSTDQNVKIINLLEEVKYLESKGEKDIDVVDIARKLGFEIINNNIYTPKDNNYLRFTENNTIIIYLSLEEGVELLRFERNNNLYNRTRTSLILNCDVLSCFVEISRY